MRRAQRNARRAHEERVWARCCFRCSRDLYIYIYLYSKREKERERKKSDVEEDVCLGERDLLKYLVGEKTRETFLPETKHTKKEEIIVSFSRRGDAAI